MEIIDNNKKLHIFIKLILEEHSHRKQRWGEDHKSHRNQDGELYQPPYPYGCYFISAYDYVQYTSQGQNWKIEGYNSRKERYYMQSINNRIDGLLPGGDIIENCERLEALEEWRWEICEANEQKTQDLFDHFTQFLLAKSIVAMDCECNDCISTSPQHPKFTDHGKVIFEDDEKIKVIVDEFLAVYKEKSGYNSIPNHISELQQIKCWDNGELKTIFDMNGNLFLEFYENGNPKRQYDKEGNLIIVCYEDGHKKFEYDENGQLREKYGRDGEMVAEYDEDGNKYDDW